MSTETAWRGIGLRQLHQTHRDNIESASEHVSSESGNASRAFLKRALERHICQRKMISDSKMGQNLNLRKIPSTIIKDNALNLSQTKKRGGISQ